MYIKNQAFRDEDTLMEMLFDFSLGEASKLITDLKETIEKDLEENEAFQKFRLTLEGEDQLELDTEERYIRLAEALMERFDSFKVHQQKLYGLKGKEEVLLYEVDLI
jgi:hypothetical protein